jgi:hypothetical protein
LCAINTEIPKIQNYDVSSLRHDEWSRLRFSIVLGGGGAFWFVHALQLDLLLKNSFNSELMAVFKRAVAVLVVGAAR